MTAREAVHRALNDLVDAGGELPCWDRSAGNPWIGDTREEREYAAHQCGRCPLAAACELMAIEQQVSFGIFGGLDFAQRPGKRKTQPKVVA